MSFNGFEQGSGGGGGLPQGTEQLPPEYAGLANMSEEDRNAALAALLGPDGLRQLQQQQQQQMGRGRGMGGGYGGMDGGMINPGGMGGMGGLTNPQGMGGMGRGMTNPQGMGGMGGGYGGMGGGMTNPRGMGGMGGGMGGMGGGMTNPNFGGMGGGMGMEDQMSTRGLGGMQGNHGGMAVLGNGGGLGGGMRGLRPDGGGGGMDFGNSTRGPSMGGSSGGRTMGGMNGSQMFTTPQNFIGQEGAGPQYGESQLPPNMAGRGSGGVGGHTGGRGGQADSQDPAQQLIGYVKATAESCTDPIAQGMNTILILDTSTSMRLEEGLQQAKTAVENIITGIEDNVMDYGLEENLALIVFGRESRVVQHLTNDYTKLREVIETLHAEGSSAITDSLVMTLGMADRGGHINVGSHVANSRIIILSDAQFTANDPSPTFHDVLDPRHADQVATEVSHLAHQVTSASGLQLYFIPVGSVNTIIMESVIGATGGQVCLAGDAKWLSKGYLHHVIAGCILTESQGTVPDHAMVAAVAKEKYSGVQDRDIEAVIELIHEDQNSQAQGQGQGMGRGIGRGQMMGGGQGMMPAQMPSHGGPPGSLPRGLFNGENPSTRTVTPSTSLPSTQNTPLTQNTLSRNATRNTSSLFPSLEMMGDNLPSGTGSMMTSQLNGGAPSPVFDLNSKLPPNLPPALIGGEGARRSPPEVTTATITAGILKKMDVSPELEETRKRCWTLTEEIIEEMKRDLAAGKEAPKPWDSRCLQEFLLIRKDGTKIEQDGQGMVIGDDEEAVLRREEKAKQKLLWEELKKVCENHPDLPLPLNLDDDEDIGDLTEERVNELLDDFGGGPPKIENLPTMPAIGLRVKPGPDWMWKCNGVGIREVGTVIGIDQEDEGWIRVRWDEHNGLEEDYRWGLDYEFDVEPLEGGMAAVLWPEGKERIIKTTQDIADEFGPKQVKEKLRKSARARREQRQRAEAAGSSIEPTLKPSPAPQDVNKPSPAPQDVNKPSPAPQDVNSLNLQNIARNQQVGQKAGQQADQQAGHQQETSSLLPPRVPMSTAATAPTSVTPAASMTTKQGSKDNGQSRSDRPAAAAKPSESCFVWQYVNEQGDWKNYPPEIQKQLEETYLKRKEKGTVIIQMEGQFERVVFQCMEQRNNANKKKIKKVRRIEADAESLRELQEMWAK